MDNQYEPDPTTTTTTSTISTTMNPCDPDPCTSCGYFQFFWCVAYDGNQPCIFNSSDGGGCASDADCGHGGGIAPEDSFLIQVRGTSRPAESAISGRVEHLHSGSSEQFGSLAGVLAAWGRR